MYLPSSIKSKRFFLFILIVLLVLLPFKGLIQGIFLNLSRKQYLLSNNQYLKKIEDLEKQNLELQLNSNKFKNLMGENEKLRNALDLKISRKLNILGAQILSFSPSHWKKFAFINKGKSDNLKKGDYVINEEGFLLGSISMVDNESSKLIFTNDPDFSITVFVGNNALGLLVGNFTGAKILYIENGEDIKKGDKVWVRISDQAGVIDIGRVKRVQKNKNNLFWDIDIDLFAKKSFFEKVFVVK